MASWFTFLRSQDDVTATVTVNYGIDVAAEIPQRPLLFLIVRNLDRPTDRPSDEFDASVTEDLEKAGALIVGVLTMGPTRTIVSYGSDETRARQALGAYNGGIAFQAQHDPEWQIYRTLLPTDTEVTDQSPPPPPS
ncbi:MAG TPA: hypothetical protein VGN11_12525 [Candidatus Baltobacteraceae bacterium]|jgi:hypothetical protein|nr:hypothetical protein [Candidatus Baltobacteraceae bacterium]